MFIVIAGGVMSGIGKGTLVSELCSLLKGKVTAVKIDPYLNVDAGTMSPDEHGEVYVLADGTETDLDLGNYERALCRPLDKRSIMTTGSIMQEIIGDERLRKYGGATVQFMPHLTNKVVEKLEAAIDGYDVCVVELGGTIGDSETALYAHAIRQLKMNHNVWFGLVGMVFKLGCDVKTKPFQRSIADALSLGIVPDALFVRGELVTDATVTKLSVMSGVKNVYPLPNMKNGLASDYRVHLYQSGVLHDMIRMPTLITKQPVRNVFVGLVGKYTGSTDAYHSLQRAIEKAAYVTGCSLNVVLIDSTKKVDVTACKAVIIPGGYGSRGVDGMISAHRQCYELDIPLLAICLGFQTGIMYQSGGSSEEFGGTSPVICAMPTARTGLYALTSGNLERFRHSYATTFDKYATDYVTYGTTCHTSDNTCGTTCTTYVAEYRIPDKKFNVGVQYHPEYSASSEPHRLFVEWLQSA